MTEYEKYSLINYKAELIQMKKSTLLKSEFFNIEEYNYNQACDSTKMGFTKVIRRIGWKRPLTSDEKKKAQLCMEVFNTTVTTCEINTSLQLAKNWWTALKKGTITPLDVLPVAGKTLLAHITCLHLAYNVHKVCCKKQGLPI